MNTSLTTAAARTAHTHLARVATPITTTLLVAALASTALGQSQALHDERASDLKNGPTAGRIHIADPYPAGHTIVDGDVIVREPEDDSYATLFEESDLWTNQIVYYAIDINVHPSQEVTIEKAMADWEAISDVLFVEFPAPNHVHIRMSDTDQSPSCSSSIGMIGGTQTLNLTAACLTDFRVHHELGHALGLHHEQKRGDAPTYVTFNFANMENGSASQFFPAEPFAEEYGPYDFESVMHYGQYDFSICTPQDVNNGICPAALTTIDVNAPWTAQFQSVIGHFDYLSEWDITLMSFLYAEDDWVFGDDNATGIPDGSFLQPWPGFATALVSTPAGGQAIALSPETVSGLGLLDEPVTIVAPLGGLILE